MIAERFRLLGAVDSGNMGEVHKAEDLDAAPCDVDRVVMSKRRKREWLLGWRDICRATDERTAIVGTFPRAAVGSNLPVSALEVSDGRLVGALQACLARRVAELSYTAHEMKPFARDLGDTGTSFI